MVLEPLDISGKTQHKPNKNTAPKSQTLHQSQLKLDHGLRDKITKYLKENKIKSLGPRAE